MHSLYGLIIGTVVSSKWGAGPEARMCRSAAANSHEQRALSRTRTVPYIDHHSEIGQLSHSRLWKTDQSAI
jgi:hypothetical protein